MVQIFIIRKNISKSLSLEYTAKEKEVNFSFKLIQEFISSGGGVFL